MGCNCNKVVTAPPSKFGSCALCMYVTLSGFLCSWLLIVPFLFVPISTTLFVVLSLPAAFFTVWLSLHLAASHRKRISVVYLNLDHPTRGSAGITKREATKMNNAKLSLLIALLYLATCGEVFAAQIWVNNNPDALVKQVEIYTNDNAVPVPGNPLSPTEGLINITFQNDVEYIGLALHPTAGSISPSFFSSVDGNYSLFTVYYCEAGSNPAIGQTCDGIALRSENAQLCAGFFQYNTLADRVFTIADIGCFTPLGVGTVTVPRLSRRDFLQKYTKEQLIDILNGVRPINPIGPVCLSCPPWEGYGKDMAVKLQKLPVRKFRIEVKEIK